jgi:hypothetical protein
MIGIGMPRMAPVQFANRFGCGLTDAGWFRADECMLAIRFVPNRDGDDPILFQLLKGSKLRYGLVCESIANAEGKSIEKQHGIRSKIGEYKIEGHHSEWIHPDRSIVIDATAFA